jgi:hypothetical protein
VLAEVPPSQIEAPDPWLFCSGHVRLGAGSIFFSGGGGSCFPGQANKTTKVFIPYAHPELGVLGAGPSEIWTCASSLEVFRWYPSVTKLAEGLLVLGGVCTIPDGKRPVILETSNDLPTQWTWNPLCNAKYGDPNDQAAAPFDIGTYLFTYLASDATVVMCGGRDFYQHDPNSYIARRLDVALESWVANYQPASAITGASACMFQKDIK